MQSTVSTDGHISTAEIIIDGSYKASDVEDRVFLTLICRDFPVGEEFV